MAEETNHPHCFHSAASFKKQSRKQQCWFQLRGLEQCFWLGKIFNLLATDKWKLARNRGPGSSRDWNVPKEWCLWAGRPTLPLPSPKSSPSHRGRKTFPMSKYSIQKVNILGFEMKSPCCNYSALLLWSKRSHRQFVKDWVVMSQ